MDGRHFQSLGIRKLRLSDIGGEEQFAFQRAKAGRTEWEHQPADTQPLLEANPPRSLR